MPLNTRLFICALAAALSTPKISFAQTCTSAEATANQCYIPSTVASTTVTGRAVGVGSGTTPVVAAARYLGGIAYFKSDFFFFQGFFNSGFNVANPLANAADYTLIGGKGEGSGSSIIDSPAPWVALPGVYSASQELVFGLRVNTYDFIGAHQTDWFFSGYGLGRNSIGRYDGIVGDPPQLGFANLFLGGTAPVSDDVSGVLRAPSPVFWTSAYNAGHGYFDGTGANAVLGFEDNRWVSDGDFNDAVIALDFSVVPEPASLALVAVGLGVTAAVARRRRKRNLKSK